MVKRRVDFKPVASVKGARDILSGLSSKNVSQIKMTVWLDDKKKKRRRKISDGGD